MNISRDCNKEYIRRDDVRKEAGSVLRPTGRRLENRLPNDAHKYTGFRKKN